MVLLNEYEFESVEFLKERKAAVEGWKREHEKKVLVNKSEKLALANVVLGHFEDYIKAYESRDLEKLLESSLRHIAVCKVALEVLTDPNNQTLVSK